MALSGLSILGIAVGLAMDAFAVAVAAGLSIAPLTFRHVFRLSFHFGLFQFMMPVAGWLAGRTLAEHIAPLDHWVGFALLAFIGAKMLRESRAHHRERPRADPTRGLTLVMFSLATSIDALAVGVSMALLNVSVWWPSAVIGVVAAGLTCVGITFGSRLGRPWGRRAEALGGLVLIALGLHILISHLAR